MTVHDSRIDPSQTRAPTVRSRLARPTPARDLAIATMRHREKKEKKAKNFAFRSVLDVSARDFVDDKDTDAYRAFHMKRVGTRELEITRDDVDERTGERTMVIRTVPGIKLPRLVRGVVPNGRVEFVDTRRYRAGAEKRFPFAQEFTTLNNITKHSVVRGTITVTETGEKSCVVDVKGECRVSLRGIGGIIENIVVGGIEKAYATLPQITREWAAHKARVANGELDGPVEVGGVGEGEATSPMSRTQSESTLGGASSYYSAAGSIRDEDEDEERGKAVRAKSSVKKRTMKRTSSFWGCCASKPMVVGDENENEETRFEKFHSVQVRSMH